MSFNGGGSGGAITQHVHSSDSGEGGSLSSELTELNDGNLFSLMVALG